MRLLPRPLRDNWRWHLDPRDPDYEEPPTPQEIEEAEELAVDIILSRDSET